ncbi:MAG: class I SAM-dependent rRNA methyltransferase [Planctomycetota bacterium]|nr:MAG: class I SAM-dependent rRNA methyltransferase [Planctomycetota bacterium]REJ85668.1 MAG: class I SAM-dependent rRNA methyltransferase [Planctomycetota bacterium]REK21440.1 MAG: class I SAM-dependent rRNA methyltransferase [Planctomycetota bacterium]REK40048.1 MAG: class I SAM-dependent rRNA methyltransferase [Planctomycetota bacterium]
MNASDADLARVVIKRRRALPFFSGHPWVFAGAIQRVEGEPAAGAEVNVSTHEGEFIARGLFNPQSNIRVRLYTWDANQRLDEDFWSGRIKAAIDLRNSLFQGGLEQRGCRMIFSEADGLSGLVVDRYGDHLLLQWTSRALAEREPLFVKMLQEQLQPAGIWRRTEKGMAEAEGLSLTDGLVAGAEPPLPLFVEEHGLQYGVDVVAGQKTGFYFDQRDNRLAAARYLSGRVLDLFCYSGGFGLNALRHGSATQVLGVDSSQPALDFARRNAELNSLADRMRFEQSAAFAKLEQLHEAGEQFDGVILDPPKMARSRGGLERALRGYLSLNRLAVQVLKPGGILVTCSCSGLVSREDFEQVLARVAAETGRKIQILESRGQAADHPVSVQCLENAYLKCLICRVTA